MPPYLSRANFDTVRARVDRMTVHNANYTEFLSQKPAGSVDRFVLLDAQDWMNDAQLNALWSEISRTAAPGARAIFRTAAEPSLLPGRVDPSILEHWHYREEESRLLHDRDRSSIYGGFHLYVLKGRDMSANPRRFPGQAQGIDHASLMDRVYRRQRHFYDATRKYYLWAAIR